MGEKWGCPEKIRKKKYGKIKNLATLLEGQLIILLYHYLINKQTFSTIHANNLLVQSPNGPDDPNGLL